MANKRNKRYRMKTPKWLKDLLRKWKKTAVYKKYLEVEPFLSVVGKPVLVLLLILALLIGYMGATTVEETAEANFVDVSVYQGRINWYKAHEGGVDNALIRCGVRRSSSGNLEKDKYFEWNFRSCRLCGVRRGVYFYSQAVNEKEAIEEANFVLDCLKERSLDLPVYIDVEATGTGEGRADSLTAEERTTVVHAFMKTIKEAGYEPGVYSNAYFLEHNLNITDLPDCSVWVANYSDHLSYSGDYDIWQYSDAGTVPGIDHTVDLNRMAPSFAAKLEVE